MRNGWFWCIVLPLMCVSSLCLWNRALRWGMAGFETVSVTLFGAGDARGMPHVMGVMGWSSVILAFAGVSLLPGFVVSCPLHVIPREPLDLEHKRLHISIRFACV